MTFDPKDDLDNHSNQMNPNNDSYWDSRGFDGRPDDWDDDDDDDRFDDHDDDGMSFFTDDL